jgi:negative regulator of flagellin synthesis FlgM
MRIKTDAYTGGAQGAANAAASKAREAQARSAHEAGVAQTESNEAVRVTVSDKARALAASADASRFDEAKVTSLREAINDGTFKVDAQKIAHKIVDPDGD